MAVAIYLTWVIPALWLLAFVGIGAAAWTLWRSIDLRSQTCGVGLTAAALILRATLSPWGWGDQRSTLDQALDGWGELRGFSRYGSAIEALLAPLYELFGTDPQLLEWIGLGLGALTPVALVAWLQGMRVPAVAAWLAGVVLATSPLHIRLSPTQNRYVTAAWLWCAAAAILTWRLRGDDPKSGRKLRLISGAAALALAVQCRPDALWLLGAAATLPLLGLSAGRTPRDVWAMAVWTGALLLLPVVFQFHVLTSESAWASWVSGAVGGADDGPWLRGLLSPDHNLALCSSYTPVIQTVLLVWGLYLGVRTTTTRRVTIWLAAWAAIATMIPGPSDIDRDLLSARYHLLALPLWCALIGLGGAIVAPRFSRNLQLAGAAVVVLSAFGPMPWVVRTTTLDEEVVFLRGALATIPDDCAVVAFHPNSQDLALRPAPTLSATAGRKHSWIADWSPAHPGPCAVWYSGASCRGVALHPKFEAERHAVCDKLNRVATEEIARATLTRDSAGTHTYRPGPLVVYLAWLRRPNVRH